MAQTNSMMNVRQTRLPNGLRVITSAMPHVQSVTFGVWVGVGARHESHALAGASHFIEHMLFKGTPSRSAKSISEAIEGYGGYLNAFTQEESTCFYARVAHDRLNHSLDVILDMIMNASFGAPELQRERGVILEEIMMYKDRPSHWVQELLSSSLWVDHPAGRPIIGSTHSVGNMPRAALVRYKKAGYTPGNIVVSLAGNLDHDRCVQFVRDMTGRMRRGPGKPRQQSVTPSTRMAHMTVATKDIEQAHLAMGFRLFGREDDRRYTLRVLNAILGENMSSRLFQVVREQHGLAYSIHSGADLLSGTGSLTISAGLDRRQVAKALRLILKEVVKIRLKRVGARELRRAKDYVVGQMKLGLESTTQQMLWMGDTLMSHRKFIAPETSMTALQNVTADDISKLARSVLRKRALCIALVSPDSEANMRKMIRSELRGMPA